MLNIGQIVSTVQKNCHISDARHAGDLTLCTYLLKMREFYRWENDIPLTRQLAREDVGQWLQERERMWEHLEADGFEPIPLEHGASDPFDADSVNRELVPQGYVYSGGVGRFCKPHFFLGNLVTMETRNGFAVYISSCEYARDLEAPPAMLQGRTIFVRQESVRRYLWEKVEESRWSRGNGAMQRALSCYGLAGDGVPGCTNAAGAGIPEAAAERALDRMTQNETESIVLHELGEGLAGETLGADWERLLSGLARSKAEIMARAVRDNLADCLTTLPALVETRNDASLHFYFATFDGMRRHLFPEALAAYRRWCTDGDLDPLRSLTRQGQSRWRDTAEQMLALFRRDEQRAAAEIVRLLDKDDAL
ncbi:MAG: Sfum_1244 family protein [Pseudomonadota bacterium]